MCQQTQEKEKTLYTLLRPLSLGNDSNAQPALRALQNELLVLARAQKAADSPDEDEPADNHENVRKPIARRESTSSISRGRITCTDTARDEVRVKVVRVRIGRRAHRRRVGPASTSVAAGRRTAEDAAAFQGEAVLDQGDAEASEGAVLGRVRRVQEVGEEEADPGEGHGNHAVPNKGEDGADGQAVDEDFVADQAGG
jgi:hypothetical protein